MAVAPHGVQADTVVDQLAGEFDHQSTASRRAPIARSLAVLAVLPPLTDESPALIGGAAPAEIVVAGDPAALAAISVNSRQLFAVVLNPP